MTYSIFRMPRVGASAVLECSSPCSTFSPTAKIEEMAGRNTPLTRVDMRVELSVVAEFVESQLAPENILRLKKTALFLCCYFPLHYLCNATASLHN